MKSSLPMTKDGDTCGPVRSQSLGNTSWLVNKARTIRQGMEIHLAVDITAMCFYTAVSDRFGLSGARTPWSSWRSTSSSSSTSAPISRPIHLPLPPRYHPDLLQVTSTALSSSSYLAIVTVHLEVEILLWLEWWLWASGRLQFSITQHVVVQQKNWQDAVIYLFQFAVWD